MGNFDRLVDDFIHGLWDRIEEIRGVSPGARCRTVQRWAWRPTARRVDRIIKAAADEDASVRCVVIDRLDSLAGRKILPDACLEQTLLTGITAVADCANPVRETAVRLLSRLSDARIAPAAYPLLDDSDDKIRDLAIRCLRGQSWAALTPGQQARAAVLLKDHDRFVALGPAGVATVLRHVRDLHSDAELSDADRLFVYAASDVLSRVRDKAGIRFLIASLSSESLREKAVAVEAFTAIRTTDAVKPLIRCLSDGKLRSCAARALAHIGDARAIEPLLRLRKDGYDVRNELLVLLPPGSTEIEALTHEMHENLIKGLAAANDWDLACTSISTLVASLQANRESFSLEHVQALATLRLHLPSRTETVNTSFSTDYGHDRYETYTVNEPGSAVSLRELASAELAHRTQQPPTAGDRIKTAS